MTSDAMHAILTMASSIAIPDSDRIEDRRAATSAQLRGPLAEGTAAHDSQLGGLPALWIRPMTGGSTNGRIVLYLHGGAFEVGSPTDYQAFCSNLALRLEATVVIPDYRLAPEHPFPTAVHDVLAAYRALLTMGYPSSAVALLGDSAGGGLVVSCLIAARRAGLPQPVAAVGLSSWIDLTLEADAHTRCAATDPFISTVLLKRAAQHYLAGADPRDPLASPIYALPEELAGLGPILLQAAANEVLADDSSAMAARITAAGGDVTLELCPAAFHVWHLAGDHLPESRDALECLARFLRSRWGGPLPNPT